MGDICSLILFHCEENQKSKPAKTSEGRKEINKPEDHHPASYSSNQPVLWYQTAQPGPYWPALKA